VARQIEMTVREIGHEVKTVKAGKEVELNILAYDFVFVGSGVYMWLPGKPMMKLFERLREGYAGSGEIESASPRRQGKKAVVYCTYGGAHTGVNEALPTVKYMGQLFDHLGYEIIAEWYLPGEYHGNLSQHSTTGRLGNITGRPNEADLQDVSQKIFGIMKV
jgi:multimeric flavodoxin WrbA